MDEEKLLEELRAQRDQLQKHLDWLDEKMAALDVKSADDQQSVPDKPKENQQITEEVTAPSGKADDERDEVSEKELKRYEVASGDPIMRAKIGCLVLFVLSSILFLFLLFGLPYLMD